MPQLIKLVDEIQYRDHQIASKSFTHKLGIVLPFVLYALDAGESISNEQSTLTRLFEVVDGTLTVVTDHPIQVQTGEVLVIPANTLHEIRADQRCKFVQLETK
ncbi:hypothetical protein [Levilactobacillus acidifarinae]|uniref:hypothetical protein n=1 Tax=Levilactobacillus acidifarinae TaxID=267364 RepID=UPI000AC19AF9|nr:hypothetical protein [Levilactobacillus acidifarinae]GEO69682.1 hypothetical protein LAC03_15920 [Levilactobacillus acidifarinae]